MEFSNSVSRNMWMHKRAYVPVGAKRGTGKVFPKIDWSFSFCLMSVVFLEHQRKV